MKYSGLISSDARGKLGGNVGSRNKFGVYLRRHVSPVQPRSTAQLTNRNAFGAISSAWRSLSTAQQQGWNTLATQVTLKDSLGSSYSPTGAQLYMLCARGQQQIAAMNNPNVPLQLPALPAITALSAEFAYGYPIGSVTLTNGGTGYPASGTFSVTGTTGRGAGGTYVATAGVITAITQTSSGAGYSGSIGVTFSGAGTGAAATPLTSQTPLADLSAVFAPTPSPAAVATCFYVTPVQSPGRTFSSKTSYRFLAFCNAGQTSPFPLYGPLNRVLGTLPTHGRMMMKAHYVDEVTGYPGPDVSTAFEW